ncbi:MAG TPA: ABC transporter ATP-binding protein [Acidimicrobiales bacterium]|nr:ABC transporter ATP-binding protein [Acidimicrobiales bacterium]
MTGPPTPGTGAGGERGGLGAATSAPTAVECSNLFVRYGARIAVGGLSFRAHRGEVLTILGPNGAGKTSTVETLEGYRSPDDGHVRVLGLDPVDQHRALIPRMGVMLQGGGVYPMLSPRQALDLFASYYEEPEPGGDLLERVDLRAVAHTPWRHLSGGEQQRLSLALALIGRPEVLLLDEPTSGVDPHGRAAIRQVIADLKARDACVVLTTHELGEAERLSDRVVILRDGTLVAEGSPRELASAAGRETLRFVAEPRLDVDSLSAELGATVVEEQPGEYRVETAPTPRISAALTAWLAQRDVSLTELRTVRSLEEVYLSLVGEGAEDREAGGPTGIGEEAGTAKSLLSGRRPPRRGRR